MLETPVMPVDTISMSDLTALLTDQQELISVLAAYRSAEQSDLLDSRPAAAPAADPSPQSTESEPEARWVPRLPELPGIPSEQLAPLHGQLIAHGLLRFNLLSRTAGVGYRVTPEGREALAAAQ